MLADIETKTARQLRALFDEAVKKKRFTYDEFDRFLNDVLVYGTVVMSKIIEGHVEEEDLADIEEIIILSRENMFSEN